MTLTDTETTLGIVVSLSTLLVLFVAWLRWARPLYKRLKKDLAGTRDAILGREAVRDSITGKVLAEPQPGVGIRLAHQEKQMETLTRAVGKIAESHEMLASHARLLEQLERRVASLESGVIERVVTRAESTEAWRAMQAAHESGQREDFIDGETDD